MLITTTPYFAIVFVSFRLAICSATLIVSRARAGSTAYPVVAYGENDRRPVTVVQIGTDKSASVREDRGPTPTRRANIARRCRFRQFSRSRAFPEIFQHGVTQESVKPGLVALALPAEPRDHIRVQTHGE